MKYNTTVSHIKVKLIKKIDKKIFEEIPAKPQFIKFWGSANI